MIKHIVMFRLKEFAEGKSKEENLMKFNELLSELPDRIPEIKQFEHGINFSQSSNASDICLVSAFETNEDLDVYRNHPEHKKVVEFILKVSEESRVVDFNWSN